MSRSQILLMGHTFCKNCNFHASCVCHMVYNYNLYNFVISYKWWWHIPFAKTCPWAWRSQEKEWRRSSSHTLGRTLSLMDHQVLRWASRKSSLAFTALHHKSNFLHYVSMIRNWLKWDQNFAHFSSTVPPQRTAKSLPNVETFAWGPWGKLFCVFFLFQE